jgi:hypothetical protein
MKIKWISGTHATQYGVFNQGDVIETKEYHIPDEVVKIWLKDGVIEEVREDRKEKKEK